MYVDYQEHRIILLNDDPRMFLLRTRNLERLDVRTYAFMLETDPELWNEFSSQKLGSICHTFLGATPKNSASDAENGVAFLKTKNIYTDRFDLSDVDYITTEAHNTRKSSALKHGDVLMTIIGASFEVIGRCVVYKGNPDPANINQNIIGIRINDDVDLDPDFLCLQLNSAFGQVQVQQKAQRTAQFSLNKGLVEDFDIIIPHDSEQKIILKRFHMVQSLKRELHQWAENLVLLEHQQASQEVDFAFAEELGLKVFRKPRSQKVFLRDGALIERLDVSANHPDYTRLVDQIRTSPMAGTLADLVDVSEERFDPRKHYGEEICYLNITDIDGLNGIAKPQRLPAEELPSQGRKLVKVGNILVGGITSGDEKMVAYLADSDNENWVVSSDIHVLQVKPKVSTQYIIRLLKAPFVLLQIRALLYGAAIKRISESDLLNLSVPVTDEKTRAKTLERIEAVLNEERVLTIRLNDISKRADTLLAKAKANIFNLLDDKKYAVMAVEAEELKQAMKQIEEALQ